MPRLCGAGNSTGDVSETVLVRSPGKLTGLILTGDEAIPCLNGVTAAPVTSTIRGVPSEVLLSGDDGMKAPCVVNLHNFLTLSQSQVGRRAAKLNAAKMREVCSALRFSLGCDPE
jgi:mRNA interferase MazF